MFKAIGSLFPHSSGSNAERSSRGGATHGNNSSKKAKEKIDFERFVGDTSISIADSRLHFGGINDKRTGSHSDATIHDILHPRSGDSFMLGYSPYNSSEYATVPIVGIALDDCCDEYSVAQKRGNNKLKLTVEREAAMLEQESKVRAVASRRNKRRTNNPAESSSNRQRSPLVPMKYDSNNSKPTSYAARALAGNSTNSSGLKTPNSKGSPKSRRPYSPSPLSASTPIMGDKSSPISSADSSISKRKSHRTSLKANITPQYDSQNDSPKIVSPSIIRSMPLNNLLNLDSPNDSEISTPVRIDVPSIPPTSIIRSRPSSRSSIGSGNSVKGGSITSDRNLLRSGERISIATSLSSRDSMSSLFSSPQSSPTKGCI